MTISKNLSIKIHAWKEIQDTLSEFKQQEIDLRKEIIAEAFPVTKLGVNTLDLGLGYKLKAQIGETTSVDEAALTTIRPKLEAHIYDSVFRFKPSVVAAAYKALPKEIKGVIDQALIVKPSSPTLAVIAPKEKK